MKKIRLIIEAEVQEHETITQEVIRRGWGLYSNYQEMLQDKERMNDVKHEQALLNALRANPKQYRENLLAILFAELTGTNYQEFYKMVGVPIGFSEIFRSLIPMLPAEASAHFQEMDEHEVLSESTCLVDAAITAKISSIHLEGL